MDNESSGFEDTERKPNRNEAGPMSPHPRKILQLGPPWNEKERCARERIEANRYDVEAWNILANEAQLRPTTEASSIYEQLLTTFPTAARYWKSYVETQMAVNNDDGVRSIFSRCLLNCLHVELWKCYIRFIRRVNEPRGVEGRDETKKAFEFLLSHVGMDIAAGPLWLDYIAFLKLAPASTPQEDSQRMTAIRKVYQRAVLVPIHHVEQLWKEYESFENSVSRALAKGLLTEYQPKHFSARAVYRERKKYCEHIDQNMLAVPATGSLKEEQQCTAWKQLIVFEKGNPQRLEPAALNKRVVFTYEQCLMCLYHYPDIWYDYATWHAENKQYDSAVLVFQRALKALPEAATLHYAFAEFEEARGNIKEAKKVYEALLRNDNTANALAYIQFMRFVRRTEGVEASRKVFTEARKAPGCTYHVYVASAAMVLCVDKDPKVARNIFELGLKKYIHEPAYVLEYADFLCRLNDDRNVRVLFERALNVLPPEESVEVWNRFMSFEQMYGDLSSMLKVEQRRKEALSQAGDSGSVLIETPLQQFISRYRFLELWPCSPLDLDHLAKQQIMTQKLPGRMEKQFITQTGANTFDRSSALGNLDNLNSVGSTSSATRPDVSQMAVYDPKQGFGGPTSGEGSLAATSLPSLSLFGSQSGLGFPPSMHGMHPLASQNLQGLLLPGIPLAGSMSGSSSMPGIGLPMRAPSLVPSALGQKFPPLPPGPPPTDSAGGHLEDIAKILPQSLRTFLSGLPTISGPFPDVDIVLSVLLKSELPPLGSSDGVQGLSSTVESGDSVFKGNGPANLDRFQSTKGPRQKRKEPDRQEEDDTPLIQSRPAALDIFRMRQLQRARAVSAGQSAGQSGTTSGGSGAFSGEPSGSSE